MNPEQKKMVLTAAENTWKNIGEGVEEFCKSPEEAAAILLNADRIILFGDVENPAELENLVRETPASELQEFLSSHWSAWY